MNGYSIISTMVENKPGVLFKVANLIRRKRFNIESITVGPVDGKDVSRMTIAVQADDATLNQIAKQLLKLIDVLDVKVYSAHEVVARELVLVKLPTKKEDSIFKMDPRDYRVIERSDQSVTLELVGSPDQIDRYLHVLESYGITEVSRTGITAVSKN